MSRANVAALLASYFQISLPGGPPSGTNPDDTPGTIIDDPTQGDPISAPTQEDPIGDSSENTSDDPTGDSLEIRDSQGEEQPISGPETGGTGSGT